MKIFVAILVVAINPIQSILSGVANKILSNLSKVTIVYFSQTASSLFEFTQVKTKAMNSFYQALHNLVPYFFSDFISYVSPLACQIPARLAIPPVYYTSSSLRIVALAGPSTCNVPPLTIT
jgi:hypothetical protein